MPPRRGEVYLSDLVLVLAAKGGSFTWPEAPKATKGTDAQAEADKIEKAEKDEAEKEKTEEMKEKDKDVMKRARSDSYRPSSLAEEEQETQAFVLRDVDIKVRVEGAKTV